MSDQTMPPKDQADTLDYKILWSRELPEGSSVVSHTVIAPAGITIEADTTDANNDAIIWISGGQAGTTYKVTSRIEANTGGPVNLIREWAIYIPVID